MEKITHRFILQQDHIADVVKVGGMLHGFLLVETEIFDLLEPIIGHVTKWLNSRFEVDA